MSLLLKKPTRATVRGRFPSPQRTGQVPPFDQDAWPAAMLLLDDAALAAAKAVVPGADPGAMVRTAEARRRIAWTIIAQAALRHAGPLGHMLSARHQDAIAHGAGRLVDALWAHPLFLAALTRLAGRLKERITDDQVAAAVRQADGQAVAILTARLAVEMRLGDEMLQEVAP